MATAVNMPQVGYDIDKGKIVEWQVKEGDSVAEGDILAVVESEKATFEVEAPAAGIVLKQLFPQDSNAPVLKPIAYIGKEGEEIPESGQASEEAQSTKSSPEKKSLEDISVQESSTPESPTEDPAHSGSGKFASPRARSIAKEQGVDIDSVPEGSGPGGRVVKNDVLRQVQQTESAPASAMSPALTSHEEDEEIPFSRMRQTIADRLSASKQAIPHFYLFTDVNMTGVMAWRKAFNERNNVHITLNDIIVKATALSLAEYPQMNALGSQNRVVLKKKVNVGIAVSVEHGLLVPVISEANVKEIGRISAESKALVERARRGIVDPTVRGTFTISNLGRVAVNKFVPIINPPEVAILGVAAIEKRVIPSAHGIEVADMVTVTLACDHRACDGSYAAGFLGSVKNNIELHDIKY